MEQTAKQRPMGLSEKQIEWCDKNLHGFRAMRLQAEQARSERENEPASPTIGAQA